MATPPPLVAFMLCLGLFGCDADLAQPPAPNMDAAPPTFIDASPLPDGTVIQHDAAPALRDAAVITEAGVCRTGAIRGVVCAPDEQTMIAGARVSAVTTDCAGSAQVVEGVSDREGRFELSGLAPGLTEVTIQTGSFISRTSVTVIAQTTVLAGGGISEKTCLEADAARLAVVTGDYDRIEDVLDGLGFSYDLYCGIRTDHFSVRELLLDPAQLDTYDVVFINCGSGVDLEAITPETAAMVQNLRAFVDAGGSIYASDLGAGFVHTPWPALMDFEANFRAPSELSTCCVCATCPARCEVPDQGLSCDGRPNLQPGECALGAGVIGRGHTGDVLASVGETLAGVLDDDTLPVVFNLGGWVQVAGVAAGVDVLVEAEDGRPLMVLGQPSGARGRVAYTSFHNHAQATEAMRALLAALVMRL